MTPKEKAIEMYEKFFYVIHIDGEQNYLDSAERATLVAINEILDLMINVFKWDENHNGNIEYWKEVREELKKL